MHVDSHNFPVAITEVCLHRMPTADQILKRVD
jgi:hypothetical protein